MLRRTTIFAGALLVGLTGITAAAPTDSAAAKLVSVQRIWNRAPYNAFTDLIFWHDQFFCVFREARGHLSADGSLRVIASPDGRHWQSTAVLKVPNVDMREAKFSVTPDDQLLLNSAIRSSKGKFQSVVFQSPNGKDWSTAKLILRNADWLWRVTWHKHVGYGFAYSTDPAHRGISLQRTRNGTDYTTVGQRLFTDMYPNEHAMVFLPDDSAVCLLRRDAKKSSDKTGALIGTAAPPYTHWQWKNSGVFAGGPAMLILPDGTIVAGVRLINGKPRTALCWVDPVRGTLTEFLAIPPYGNTSRSDVGYPGLVWHDSFLYVSFYAKAGNKCCIFLAKVALPHAMAGETNPRRK